MSVNAMGRSSIDEVASGANSLHAAARRRMELWDITDQQITEIERTQKPVRALAVPFSAVGAIGFIYLLGYNMSIAVRWD